jgi:uncharacterized membrane protein
MNELMPIVGSWCANILEATGIGTITLFALYSIVSAIVRLLKKERKEIIYIQVRQTLGRGILLGLEFLIAADIIYTVTIDLSFQSIGVLGLVILIRSFLSVMLGVEITGRWPWQQKEEDAYSSETMPDDHLMR